MAELRRTSPMRTDFGYALNVLQNKISTSFNCVRIGRILEYNKETNTCTVKILTLRQYNDTDITDYPPLSDIPLIILGGGGGGELTFPSPVGQDCVLLANDRDIDLWFEGGESYTPNTNRTHDLSDCLALCGVRNLNNPLVDYDETATTLRNDNTFVRLNDDLATVKSLVEYVDEDDNKTVTSAILSVYGGNGNDEGGEILAESSQGAHIGITDKVNVANTQQSLITLMTNFLTACEGIAVDPNSGVILPGSKQPFTDLKSQFAQLLN